VLFAVAEASPLIKVGGLRNYSNNPLFCATSWQVNLQPATKEKEAQPFCLSKPHFATWGLWGYDLPCCAFYGIITILGFSPSS